MRNTYRVLAHTIALGVAIQAASVALGFFFILHDVDDGAVITAGYDYESNVGLMIHRFGGLGLVPLAAIALLVVAFLTRAPGAVARAGTVLGLVVLQVALVFLAFTVAWGGALHGANALAVLLTSLWAGRLFPRGSHVDEQVPAVAAT